MNSAKLAIIIPAYKAAYLEQSLESIAKQTDQRFNLYVGDDASPEPVEQIVKKYQQRLSLTYHRFQENLGGRSLIQQWNRCVQLSNEPWVWMFSDDDMMEPDCVAAFYRTLEATNGRFDLYRFDTLSVDGENRPNTLNPPNPTEEGWMQYAYFLLRSLRVGTSQENIFSRAAFDQSGGWLDFPLAWGSDHASQVTWAGAKGLRRIEGARVIVRWSGQNISATRDRKLKMTKIRASMSYVDWLLRRVQEHPDSSFPLPHSMFNNLTHAWFMEHLVHQRQFFGPKESIEISKYTARTWGTSASLTLARIFKINLVTFCTRGGDLLRNRPANKS